MTRFLIIGDVVGKAGRKCLSRALPELRERLLPDAVIINGENLAGGFGVTNKIYRQCVDQWNIDAITMGNHWQDKKEIIPVMDTHDHRFVLPANMPTVHEEMGLKIFKTAGGVPFAVMNFIGNAFMSKDNRPLFEAIDRLRDRVPREVVIRFVDVHAEATSEKQGVGQYLNGWASVVYGTHCHVPTADDRVLSEGTGFCTDVGMTGAYQSVIGMEIIPALRRLRTGVKRDFEPASADPRLFALLVDVDPKSGRCLEISRVRWQPAPSETV